MKRSVLKTAAALFAAVLMLLTACAPAFTPPSFPAKDPEAYDPADVIEVPAGIRDLAEGLTAGRTDRRAVDNNFRLAHLNFSLQLALSQCAGKKENMLVSPLSVMTALAMAANGADRETLAQMEQVLGFGMPIASLNEYLGTYLKELPNSDTARFTVANSLWVRETEVKKVFRGFLQNTADYYDAAFYTAPFDTATVNAINAWVSEKTDRMIPRLIDELDEKMILMILNAIVFDAEWGTAYSGSFDKTFHGAAGDTTVKMMRSMEAKYLETSFATGFIKPYSGGYSFVALLPNRGQTPESVLKAFTPETLGELLKKPASADVTAELPQFSYDYTATLNEPLQNMGMPLAFDKDNADFSRMFLLDEYNVYISYVIHKTHIEVDENGTKAAAVTGIGIAVATGIDERPRHTVILDRPFVYMIIDNQNSLPIFIGTIQDLSN
ncbi:MAG: serpin family protein [Lachnospiraceae bacterium]|nr:serpin family protein [Lachnospiraceae bacterium]